MPPAEVRRIFRKRIQEMILGTVSNLRWLTTMKPLASLGSDGTQGKLRLFYRWISTTSVLDWEVAYGLLVNSRTWIRKGSLSEFLPFPIIQMIAKSSQIIYEDRNMKIWLYCRRWVTIVWKAYWLFRMTETLSWFGFQLCGCIHTGTFIELCIYYIHFMN